MEFFAPIEAASHAAFDKLHAVGDDMNRLPDPVRVFLLVHAAQGVIDNGGYRYLFESDWPETPHYEMFISAYEAIGCVAQAADLRRVVATFPFSNPHLHQAKRNAFIEENFDRDTFEISGWGDALCGDDEVWEKLTAYAKEHAKDFA